MIRLIRALLSSGVSGILWVHFDAGGVVSVESPHGASGGGRSRGAGGSGGRRFPLANSASAASRTRSPSSPPRRLAPSPHRRRTRRGRLNTQKYQKLYIKNTIFSITTYQSSAHHSISLEWNVFSVLTK